MVQKLDTPHDMCYCCYTWQNPVQLSRIVFILYSMLSCNHHVLIPVTLHFIVSIHNFVEHVIGNIVKL